LNRQRMAKRFPRLLLKPSRSEEREAENWNSKRRKRSEALLEAEAIGDVRWMRACSARSAPEAMLVQRTSASPERGPIAEPIEAATRAVDRSAVARNVVPQSRTVKEGRKC